VLALLSHASKWPCRIVPQHLHSLHHARWRHTYCGLLASAAGNRREILTSRVAIGICRSIAQEKKSRDLFLPVSAAPLKDSALTIRRCRALSNICVGLEVAAPRKALSFGLRRKHAGPEDLMLATPHPNNRFRHSGRRNNFLPFPNAPRKLSRTSIVVARIPISAALVPFDGNQTTKDPRL